MPGKGLDPAQITPLIITYNEMPNLPRTIAALEWAKRIVVVDSGSNDGTLEFLAADPRIEIYHNSFRNFASQCNFGLDKIVSEWVLSLDADYELSEAWPRELAEIDVASSAGAFSTRFVYRIYGQPLRASLYPPRVVLYRRVGARYTAEGHSHHVTVEGEVKSLTSVIFHDDRKPLARWLSSQQNYALTEAVHLLASERATLSFQDRLRLTGWLAPIVILPYVLFVKGCIRDGWRGWYYALQRLVAEVMLAVALLDSRLRSNEQGRSSL